MTYFFHGNLLIDYPKHTILPSSNDKTFLELHTPLEQVCLQNSSRLSFLPFGSRLSSDHKSPMLKSSAFITEFAQFWLKSAVEIDIL